MISLPSTEMGVVTIPVKGSPGLLVRIEADGRRTVGRFVNRQFQPVKISVRKKTKPVLARA